MFLTLVFLTHALAEWVEISQQHYRKPMHPYSSHNPFAPDRIEIEETTKTWIYNNRNVSEYNWNKASNLQQNVGHKRTPSLGDLRPAEGIRLKEDIYSNMNEDEFNLKTNYGPMGPNIQHSNNDSQKGIIEKVPNRGNVKRVQLNNSPVKSPALDIKNNRDIVAKNRYEELPLNNEHGQKPLGHKKVTDAASTRRRIYMNSLRNRLSTEYTNTFPIDQEEVSTEVHVLRKRPNPEFKDHINPPKTSIKQTDITQTEDFPENLTDSNLNNTKILGVTEKKHIFITQKSDINEETVTKINKELHKQSSKETVNSHDFKMSSDKISRRPVNKDHQTNNNNNRNEVKDGDHKILKKGNNSNIEENSKPQNENDKNFEHQYKNSKQDKEKNSPSKGKKPENKLGNVENLLKVMRVVTDTISQNTKRSFNDKMRYLHELKNSILDNIANRIDAVWPDDDVNTPRRHSRSTQAQARGHHVHFPSSESALMTISFLTFAVFLIKLVLQLIHTYKNKAMMVAPVMVSAGGRTVLTHHGHH